MSRDGAERLALIVRQGPYQGRSARDQLDIALAAAASGLELELFFLGPGILQLAASQEPEPADLPRGARGWSSLPTLTTVRAWVEQDTAARLDHLPLLLPVAELADEQMAGRIAACTLVWVV
jgi:sulfur relay (sulfurtransferase) DsrF/TusC family protein